METTPDAEREKARIMASALESLLQLQQAELEYTMIRVIAEKQDSGKGYSTELTQTDIDNMITNALHVYKESRSRHVEVIEGLIAECEALRTSGMPRAIFGMLAMKLRQHLKGSGPSPMPTAHAFYALLSLV
jgi:hypothetical protein